jgi:hypothetical protein
MDLSTAILRSDFDAHQKRVTALLRSNSSSIGGIHSRIDWLEMRIAAIEAHLGIVPPEAPSNMSPPTEADVLSAIERLEQESPDPKPLENE